MTGDPQPMIRFGLIGLGQQAERLARSFASAPGAELTGVASSDESRAVAFAARHGVPIAAASYAALLARPDIDVILVASPNHRHARETTSALEAGKHVLVEKPMALTVADAQRMLASARAANRLLGVFFHLRHRPAIMAARRQISSGAIGEITDLMLEWSVGNLGQAVLPPLPTHQMWREDPELAGGGALVARGVHLVDLVRFLTGAEVSVITAETDPHPSVGVDRTAHALLAAGTARARIVTSKVDPSAKNELCITGTAGSLTLRNTLAPSTHEILISTTPAGVQETVFESGDPFGARIADFSAAVAGRESSGATGADGLAAVVALRSFLDAARRER